jgi:hypothetical protein
MFLERQSNKFFIKISTYEKTVSDGQQFNQYQQSDPVSFLVENCSLGFYYILQIQEYIKQRTETFDGFSHLCFFVFLVHKVM